jgi:hypothetical protein
MSVVLSDLQVMSEAQMHSDEQFYRVLLHQFTKQVGVKVDLNAEWNSWLGPNMNFDSILEDILAGLEQPVCWGFDEADMVFGRPYAAYFFGLLRSWHNRRALDPQGPWKKLTLILSYATEAHLFITDLNQSPFNVGVRVPLRDFTVDEVEQLAELYGHIDAHLPQAIHQVTGGHPFLTRRSFVFLASQGSLAELGATAHLTDGPFADHLSRTLGTIASNEVLRHEIARALKGEPFSDPTSKYRLWSAGIISYDGREFRVPGYQKYLSHHLLE